MSLFAGSEARPVLDVDGDATALGEFWLSVRELDADGGSAAPDDPFFLGDRSALLASQA